MAPKSAFKRVVKLYSLTIRKWTSEKTSRLGSFIYHVAHHVLLRRLVEAPFARPCASAAQFSDLLSDRWSDDFHGMGFTLFGSFFYNSEVAYQNNESGGIILFTISAPCAFTKVGEGAICATMYFGRTIFPTIQRTIYPTIFLKPGLQCFNNLLTLWVKRSFTEQETHSPRPLQHPQNYDLLLRCVLWTWS